MSKNDLDSDQIISSVAGESCWPNRNQL